MLNSKSPGLEDRGGLRVVVASIPLMTVSMLAQYVVLIRLISITLFYFLLLLLAFDAFFFQ